MDDNQSLTFRNAAKIVYLVGKSNSNNQLYIK